MRSEPKGGSGAPTPGPRTNRMRPFDPGAIRRVLIERADGSTMAVGGFIDEDRLDIMYGEAGAADLQLHLPGRLDLWLSG